MYGAILGDMIGAPYEFDRGDKTKDFPLFSFGSRYTDDTVMTIAVADAQMGWDKSKGIDDLKKQAIHSMREWGARYRRKGYGAAFRNWLVSDDPQPYNSYGNGAAMRISSVGWLYEDLETTRAIARAVTEVTHNHPEGVKGAESVASAILMARNGKTKEDIKLYMIEEFEYDLSRTCDEIRPNYHHVESCQETVPEAITAFLESVDFEDAIRTAVSLGGDCDALACITGSIAEAYYGVPEHLKGICISRLPEDMKDVLIRFDLTRK